MCATKERETTNIDSTLISKQQNKYTILIEYKSQHTTKGALCKIMNAKEIVIHTIYKSNHKT